MNDLRVSHLTLRAGERVLIADLSQTFSSGEMWCVAGPNGAGKTTLIAALAGLSKAALGDILLDETELGQWRSSKLARRRALMPQASHDAFSASVLDTVMLSRFPHLTGWGWESRCARGAGYPETCRFRLPRCSFAVGRGAPARVAGRDAVPGRAAAITR